MLNGCKLIHCTDQVKLRIGGRNSSVSRSRTSCNPPSSRNWDRASYHHSFSTSVTDDRHNLGLTCDPIGGLVQIPCIERNSLGGASILDIKTWWGELMIAVKAVTAAQLAMAAGGEHTVS